MTNKIIPDPKLDRIASMTRRAVTWLSGCKKYELTCPHGFLTLHRDGDATRGGQLIAVPTNVSGSTSVLTALAQFDSSTAQELVRGYKLAKEAGLL